MSVNDATQPVVVSANAGLIDGVQAAARYVAFLISAVTALLALFTARDTVGIMTYLQTNGGQIVGAVSGLVALGVAAYGVIKTRKRGAQLANVAASPEVPNSVATIK